MNTKKYRLYCISSAIGIILASFYPLRMGFRVIYDMIKDGTVLKENYPKYVIPYTPICFALIVGVLLMPLLVKRFRRFGGAAASVLSLGVFAASELLLEKKVVVTAEKTVAELADWQMYMCYIPSDEQIAAMQYKTLTPVEILLGEYNPAFKLHFYLISVVIILAVLHCVYGFGGMMISGDRTGQRSLVAQSAATASFIGMCIWACFTAFYRDGNIIVSPLSALLMSAFFILLGLTVGIYVCSFLLGKKKSISLAVPAAASAAVTLIMYIGEMILLHSNLYRFGESAFFNGLPGIVLAPADILVIIASGVFMYLLARMMNRELRQHRTIHG